MDPSKQPATSQTAYKWAFASKRTKAENDALQVTRAEVGAATYCDGPSTTSGEDRSKRVQGPTLPSQADHILAREAAEEHAAAERDYQRKRDKAEARERIEDMVGPREVGRERMLEKKRERRESDRTFREKGDEGLEMDEKTLMGGGDSFKAQWVFPVITHILRSSTCQRKCTIFRETELPAEMQCVRNGMLHAKTGHPRHGSAPRPCAKRTRRRWICSCRWPSRSTGNRVESALVTDTKAIRLIGGCSVIENEKRSMVFDSSMIDDFIQTSSSSSSVSTKHLVAECGLCSSQAESRETQSYSHRSRASQVPRHLTYPPKGREFGSRRAPFLIRHDKERRQRIYSALLQSKLKGIRGVIVHHLHVGAPYRHKISGLMYDQEWGSRGEIP